MFWQGSNTLEGTEKHPMLATRNSSLWYKRRGDFPGSPEVETSNYREWGFTPWSGTKIPQNVKKRKEKKEEEARSNDGILDLAR